MRILMLLSVLFLFACGDEKSESASNNVAAAGGDGFIRLTLRGDRLEKPTVLEGTAASLKAILATDKVAVLARNIGIKSADDVYTLDQLTMSLPDKSLTTHSHDAFEATFTITGPFNEDGSRTSFSIKQSATNSGSVTITEVDGRVRGSFEIVGNPTQVNGKGLEYRLKGHFNFAR